MIYFKVVLPKDSQAFVLEDSPMRIAWFKKRLPKVVVCQSIKEMEAYFASKPICDFIFLDHDLGEGNGTGVEAAYYLTKTFGGNAKSLLIHSWNERGVREMQAIIPGATHIAFGEFELEVEKE